MAMILTDTAAELQVLTDPRMTVDEFFQFCEANPDWRPELTAGGEVEIMPPTGHETGRRNAEIIAQLRNWAKKDSRGQICDSSSGFRLGNGAVRSPDASWVLKSRVSEFTREQRKRALPICPDFVIELTSPPDRLSRVQAKMQEYLDNGAQLGWLIDADADAHKAYIYRPNLPVEQSIEPARLIAEAPIEGFTLEMAEIWDPE